MNRESIYAALPRLLQDIALNLEGLRVLRLRYGGEFPRIFSDYLDRDRWSHDDVIRWRDARTARLLEDVWRRSDWWRARLRRAGVEERHLGDPTALPNVPVMTKDDVRDFVRAERSITAPGDRELPVHTSGTTGSGLIFTTTVSAMREQWAVWWRHWSRHGIDRGTWCAVFAGRTLFPKPPKNDVYWRVNRPGRQVLYSQYHLNDFTIDRYLDDLLKRPIDWYHGYPSFLHVLCELGVGKDTLRRLRPRIVTVSAENLHEHQRSAIRAALERDPVEHYGLAEASGNVSRCPAGSMHVDEDFARIDLDPIGDDQYRIIGTSLTNTSTPFIRYDTGDVATFTDRACPCGLPGRVLDGIDGRSEDVLELSDGSRVGRLDHLFKDLERIGEAQIRQARPGACRILVVGRPGFGPADERALRAECRSRFGDRLEVAIERVERIGKSARGKLRLVVRE